MKIAIIGCGVIGLSTGVRLLEEFPTAEVVIYAESLSPNTTSDIAAGLWFPYANEENQIIIKKWGTSTYEFLTNVIRTDPKHHTYGMILQDLYRLREHENIKMTLIDTILPNSRYLNEAELKLFGNHRSGIACTTVMSQGTKLVSYLMEKFVAKGGRVINERIHSFDTVQARESYRAIINCSGLGAKELCNDTEIFSLRGQIVIVEAPWVKYALANNGAYVLPQSDGTVVLGGTSQKNNYDLKPNDEDTTEILNKCFKLLPGLKECKVERVKVGLRPCRSSVRLEMELRTNPENNEIYPIIHNYGHGGSGLTLFWGCAIDAVELVNTVLVHDLI